MDALERGKQHRENDQKGSGRTVWAKGYVESYVEFPQPPEYDPHGRWGRIWTKGFIVGWLEQEPARRKFVKEICDDAVLASRLAMECEAELESDDQDDAPEPAWRGQYDHCPLADVNLTLSTLLEAYAAEDDPDSGQVVQEAQHVLKHLKPPGYEPPPPPPPPPARPPRPPRICRRPKCDTVLGMYELCCPICGTYQPPKKGGGM